MGVQDCISISTDLDVPKVDPVQETLIVEEKTINELECKATAYPVPIIQWFFASDLQNFVEITDKATKTTEQVQGFSLEVTSKISFGSDGISRFNSGSYNCRVTNPEAIIDNYINVTVECKYDLL